MKAILTVTVADGDGEREDVSVYVNVDTADTVTSLIEDFLTPFHDAIASMITGAIPKASITIEPDISGFDLYVPEPAGSTADIEEKITFIFATPTGFKKRVSIPTAWDGLFVNSGRGKEADVTNFGVLSFITVMTEDTSNGGVNATDLHGFDLSRYVRGFEDFHGNKS